MQKVTQINQYQMSSKKRKKISINSGHYLELMDRLYVLSSILEEHCLQHPLSDHDRDIYEAIEKAVSATYDAYQIVGHKDNENESQNNTH